MYVCMYVCMYVIIILFVLRICNLNRLHLLSKQYPKQWKLATIPIDVKKAKLLTAVTLPIAP